MGGRPRCFRSLVMRRFRRQMMTMPVPASVSRVDGMWSLLTIGIPHSPWYQPDPRDCE